MPQPDGPTSTMNSPSAISRVTSSTAVTFSPKTFVTPSRRMPWPGRAGKRRMIAGGGRCLGIHGHATVTQPSNAFAGAAGPSATIVTDPAGTTFAADVPT